MISPLYIELCIHMLGFVGLSFYVNVFIVDSGVRILVVFFLGDYIERLWW